LGQTPSSADFRKSEPLTTYIPANLRPKVENGLKMAFLQKTTKIFIQKNLFLRKIANFFIIFGKKSHILLKNLKKYSGLSGVVGFWTTF
jgi:adenine-specific DNA methylase